jgi:hypothetical protein
MVHTMVLKVALVILGTLIAFALIAFTYLAATGTTLKIDFSSPGPIDVSSERPALQPVDNTATVGGADQGFRFPGN